MDDFGSRSSASISFSHFIISGLDKLDMLAGEGSKDRGGWKGGITSDENPGRGTVISNRSWSSLSTNEGMKL